MNVYDIVREYLESHGYDGLAGVGCGCLLDDLAPCQEMADCIPGYKKTWEQLTPEQQELFEEYCGCEEVSDWYIVPEEAK